MSQITPRRTDPSSSKERLQVLFDREELDEIRATASRNRMTVAEWVRQTLRAARRNETRHGLEERLEIIRRAAEHQFPTGDIDQMLAEIERGYLDPTGS